MRRTLADSQGGGLFDSSVLVASLVKAHPAHERAAAWHRRVLKTGAEILLTLNPDHFRRVWPPGAERVQVP